MKKRIDLLKLKHWQLLCLMHVPFLPLILIDPSYAPSSIISFIAEFILVIFHYGIQIYWIWNIGTRLQEKNTEKDNRQDMFRLSVRICSIYIALIYILIMYTEVILHQNRFDFIGPYLIVFALASLLLMPCMLYIYYYTAKSLLRFQKHKDSIDVLVKIFLLGNPILGVWIIQPKLNRLSDKEMT